MGLEWDADYVPSVKLGTHIMQMLLAFVIFILEIILMRSDGAARNGNNSWPLALCFLSIPAWLYLIMTPRFERTRHAMISSPHAFACIDAIWTVFWLSAFASQAAYTSRSCGSACHVSKAIVGMAFFATVFWCVSSFLSIYTLKYWNFNGTLPGYEKLGVRTGQNIDPDKAAFSTSMAPHDEEAYAPVHADDQDELIATSRPYNADSRGSRGSRPIFDSDTAYKPQSTTAAVADPYDTGYRAHSTSPPDNNPYSSSYVAPPTSGRTAYVQPTAVEEYDPREPARFPDAPYDRTLH